jgi:hypothetical protein
MFKREQIFSQTTRLSYRHPFSGVTDMEHFRRQKDLLDTFLATGAISQAQHDKSLNCLIEKMGIDVRNSNL